MRGRLDQVTPIDVLPDEVLLAIFDFCVVYDQNSIMKKTHESWQSLVHVCRRWRSLVFQSPRRLNLQLYCSPETPVRDTLDVWPALPLIIRGNVTTVSSMDNVIAALEQSAGNRHRECQVVLSNLIGVRCKDVLAAMQVPFPALTNLDLHGRFYGFVHKAIPDTFLGGSAPRLRHLTLNGIPFPGLPKLLSSANHLVDLSLHNIPHSGYISPEAMATCLSMLTSLNSLWLEFESPQSRPDRESRRPPPMTRSILPNLTTFWFNGASKYLEDLVARIDTPRLDFLSITFFYETNFDTPHLVEFISHTRRFEEPLEADMRFDFFEAEVGLSWTSHNYPRLRLQISCEVSDAQFLSIGQQFSSVTQVCTRCMAPFPTVESLRVFARCPHSLYNREGAHNVESEIESNQWLDLLRPFTAVKSLYLFKEFQQSITFALQEIVGGRMTEVLPSLQNIFLEVFEPSGPFQEAIGQFLAARELSGHPITILQDGDLNNEKYSRY